MTGEMNWIKRDGTDSNGDTWETHANIAKRMRVPLRPFDVYIGPYIAAKQGKIFLSSEDGYSGEVCLWPDGVAPAYREPMVCGYAPFNDADAACLAVGVVLRQYRKAHK